MMRQRTRGLALSLSFAAFAGVAAQTPPSAPTFRAVTTEVPANRITLSVDQVRALMIAHHRDVAAGTSEDNMVTIVLSSAGEFVASGSSKVMTVARAAVVGADGAGAVIAAGGRGGDGGGAVAASASGGGGAGGGVAVGGVGRVGQANIVSLSAVNPDGTPRMMTIPGVGEVDPRLIQDSYFQTYEPGDVSMNAMRVRFITLTGRVMKF